MFEIILVVLVLIHSSTVALGVGSSTIAIAGFLTAIADNNFDESERRIMGVVYFSLRVAMVLIVLSSLLILWIRPDFFGSFNLPMWVLTAILYVNAILMTKHWISRKLGPAIQAGTWYAFGFLLTIHIFDLFPLTNMVSIYFYGASLAAAILIVNACIMYLARRRERKG